MTPPRKPPTRTKRTERDYSRLEAHKQAILGPQTWGVLLGDRTPLGSHAVEGRL